MTPPQILLLFFGLPVSVLTIGMRRGLGFLGLAKVYGAALISLALGMGWMKWLGHPLWIGGEMAAAVHWIGPVYVFGSAIVGALSGALVHLQGHGAESSEPAATESASETGKSPGWVAAGVLAAVFVAVVAGLVGVELRRYGFLEPGQDPRFLGLVRTDLYLVGPVGFLSGVLSARLLTEAGQPDSPDKPDRVRRDAPS